MFQFYKRDKGYKCPGRCCKDILPLEKDLFYAHFSTLGLIESGTTQEEANFRLKVKLEESLDKAYTKFTSAERKQ